MTPSEILPTSRALPSAVMIDLSWLDKQEGNYSNRDLINKIGRTILLNAFSVSEIRDIVNLAPVSEERLALFREDPQLFGPVECSPLRLNTSLLTASVMRKSPWNRAVVRRLTDEATALVAASNRILARFTGDDAVDWEELFKSRLSDISLDIQMARKSTLPYAEAQAARYNEKASRNKKRSALQQKFSTRQRVCASMTQYLRETETERDLRFWTDMLLAVDLLSIDGMSDEETVDENEETVKVVKDPHFRHSDFRPLLAYVDATPRRMKRLFNQSGRKPFRKVISDLITDRPPPPNLPSTFYQPQYLESMKKGLVPWVPVDDDTAISPATLILELLEVEGGSTFLERMEPGDREPSADTAPDLRDSSFHLEDNSERIHTEYFHQLIRLLVEWVAFAMVLYALMCTLKERDQNA